MTGSGAKTEPAQKPGPKAAKPGRHWIVRWTAYVAIFLASLPLLALFLLQHFADDFVEALLAHVYMSTGIVIDAGATEIMYLPRPAIRVSQVNARVDNLRLQAQAVSFRPGLRALLHGRIAPALVDVTRPRIRGVLPVTVEDLLAQSESAPAGNGKSRSIGERVAALLPTGGKLIITEAQISVRDKNANRIFLEGLNTELALTGLPENAVSGSLSLDAIELRHKGLILSASAITLNGNSSLDHPLTDFAAYLEARATLPWLDTHVRTEATISGTKRGLAADGTISGNYYFDNAAIPFELAGSLAPVSRDTGPESVNDLPYLDILPRNIKDKDLRVLVRNLAMGEDSAAVDGILQMTKRGPEMTGRLSLTRCSLTRWLGFARDLSPGLMHALDEITEGIMDFSISPAGLYCPRIVANSCGSEFRGCGGVPNWSKPVICLDLHSQYVDLGRAIPESVGVLPKEPEYTHRPLTEMTFADFEGHPTAKAPTEAGPHKAVASRDWSEPDKPQDASQSPAPQAAMPQNAPTLATSSATNQRGQEAGPQKATASASSGQKEKAQQGPSSKQEKASARTQKRTQKADSKRDKNRRNPNRRNRRSQQGTPDKDTVRAKADKTPSPALTAQSSQAAMPPASSQQPAGQAAVQAAGPAAGQPSVATATPEDNGFPVDFDIRLGADAIKHGYVTYRLGLCTIEPGTLGPDGLSRVLLKATASLYGGQLQAQGLIGGTEEVPTFDLKAKGVGVSASGLSGAMDFIPVREGALACDIAVLANGKEIDRFLNTLHGTINVWGGKGRLTSYVPEKARAFTGFTGTLALTKANFADTRLGLDGKWKAKLQAGPLSFDLESQGLWRFGGPTGRAGVSCQNAQTQLFVKNLDALADLPAKNVPAQVKGTCNYQTWSGNIELKNGSLSLPGLQARGNFSLNHVKKPLQFAGRIAEFKIDTPEFSRGILGAKADIPDSLRRITGACRIESRPGGAQVSALSASMGKTDIRGQFRANFQGKVPDFVVELRAKSVNIDAYMGNSAKGDSAREDKPKPFVPSTKEGKGPVWNLTALQKFNLHGRIGCDELVAGKVRVTDVSSQVSMENGRLKCQSLQGRCHGGQLTGSGTVIFGRGLALACDSTVRGIEIGPFLKDQGLKTLLSGIAQFSSKLSCEIDRDGQMPARLNGSLSVDAVGGRFQPVDEHGNPKGKPTPYTRVTGSGSITDGVIESKNFKISGKDMVIIGGGIFDLTKRSMDCKLVADFRGLPEIPVRLYGPFGNTKTSVNGGMVFVNTIFGLIKGTFGLVGGLVGGLASVFSSHSHNSGKSSAD